MKIDKLKQELTDGLWDDKLEYLYADEDLTEPMRERYLKAIDIFSSLYDEDDVMIFSAPGRTEIGGNHTDHQHGCVLAAAVNLDTIAVVSKTDDNCIQISSEGFDIKPIYLSSLLPVKSEAMTSEALIRGVAAGLHEHGYHIGGFHAYLTSNVLEGAGLSSSAAFEVLIATILSGLYNHMKIDPIEIAKISQYSENTFFQKPCGLMDQMASSVGGFVFIDFKDITAPAVKKIDYDFDACGYSLCIINTKGSHADLTDDYAAIPHEMKQIASFFHKEVLRDVAEEEFYEQLPILRKEVGDRPVLRAFHFFAENKRAQKEAKALLNNNLPEFLHLITASGSSSYQYLQNVYSLAHPEQQNISIALCLAQHLLDGAGAHRVHGGGFAGTIQAFVPNAKLKNLKLGMEAVFGADSCHILQIRPCGGIRFL